MAMEGPLAAWSAGMAERLEAMGYARSTAARHMGLVGRLSRSLARQGRTADQLSAEVLDEFFMELHAHHGASWPTPKSFRWLLDYLGEVGVTAKPAAAEPGSQAERLIGQYRHYLVAERGLAAKTVIVRNPAEILMPLRGTNDQWNSCWR